MMSQKVEIVVVENNGEFVLILHNARFYEDGSLKEGWVNNGAWSLEVDRGGQWWSDIGKVSTPDVTSKYVVKRITYTVGKEEDILYGKNLSCEHNIIHLPRGSVECSKCGGWFSYLY